MGQRIISRFIVLLLVFFHSEAFAQKAHFGKVFDKNLYPSTKITKAGKNRQPLFVSNSGFIFVSKDRKDHSDPQLYFRDLNTGKEKRITHQIGEINGGSYLENSGEILYSSSTDEEKEAPFILKKYLSRFPASVKNDAFFQLDFRPQEIYKSQIDGSEIERLTEFSGFDAFPVYLPKKDRLYFSRWEDNQVNLFAKSLKRNLAPWKVMKTKGHDLGLQLSPQSDKFAWYRFSPDFKSSQVLISALDFKNPTYVTLDSGVNWSPTWHPNGRSIIYSAKNDGSRDFNLFEVSPDGECKRQITSERGDEFFPTISPDGKTLLYTSTRSGQEEIYKMTYPGPLSCQ